MACQLAEIPVGVQDRGAGGDGGNGDQAVCDAPKRLARRAACAIQARGPLERVEPFERKKREAEQRAAELLHPALVEGAREHLGQDDLRDADVFAVSESLLKS